MDARVVADGRRDVSHRWTDPRDRRYSPLQPSCAVLDLRLLSYRGDRLYRAFRVARPRWQPRDMVETMAGNPQHGFVGWRIDVSRGAVCGVAAGMADFTGGRIDRRRAVDDGSTGDGVDFSAASPGFD